jgi:hypothetical protein
MSGMLRDMRKRPYAPVSNPDHAVSCEKQAKSAAGGVLDSRFLHSALPDTASI